jgi:pyridoxamine 5'-phosphate oxidase
VTDGINTNCVDELTQLTLIPSVDAGLNYIFGDELFQKLIIMLFSHSDNPTDIWQSIKHELHRGALDPKHPFRYVNLGTVGQVFPQVRTVVLREVTSSLDFLVYTDFRSEKVREIQSSPMVALHFYNPKKMLQIRVEAELEIHYQDKFSEQYWKKIPDGKRSEYTGSQAPGTPISNPYLGWEISDKSFFTVLKIIPQRIGALQLSKEGHLRIEFEKGNGWSGQWLVP